MLCTVFSVQNATFICVSLKSFVVFLVPLPLYVKVKHFFPCCEFTFFSSYGLGSFMTWFILYLLFCSVFFF
jgi:hypothetical protein